MKGCLSGFFRSLLVPQGSDDRADGRDKETGGAAFHRAAQQAAQALEAAERLQIDFDIGRHRIAQFLGDLQFRTIFHPRCGEERNGGKSQIANTDRQRGPDLAPDGGEGVLEAQFDHGEAEDCQPRGKDAEQRLAKMGPQPDFANEAHALGVEPEMPGDLFKVHGFLLTLPSAGR